MGVYACVVRIHCRACCESVGVSYNVQVRTEQNVEELLDYNTDHQQSQLKFMLNTQFIYLGNIADYVAKKTV